MRGSWHRQPRKSPAAATRQSWIGSGGGRHDACFRSPRLRPLAGIRHRPPRVGGRAQRPNQLDPATQTDIISQATEAVVVRVMAEMRNVPKPSGQTSGPTSTAPRRPRSKRKYGRRGGRVAVRIGRIGTQARAETTQPEKNSTRDLPAGSACVVVVPCRLVGTCRNGRSPRGQFELESLAGPIAACSAFFKRRTTPTSRSTIDTLEREIDWLFDRGADGIVMAMVSEVLRLRARSASELAEHACRLAHPRGAGRDQRRGRKQPHRRGHARARRDGRRRRRDGRPADRGGAGRRTNCSTITGGSCRPIEFPSSCKMPAAMSAGRCRSRCKPDCSTSSVRACFSSPRRVPIGPRLIELHAATGGRARVFEGTGGIALVDSYRRGIVGTMPGADLIDAIVALWRALKRGDEARGLSHLAAAGGAGLACSIVSTRFLAIEKYLLVKQGVFRNTIVRGPVGYQLDEPDAARSRPAVRPATDGG